MRVFNTIIKKHMIETARSVKKTLKTSFFSAILSCAMAVIFACLFIFILMQVVESYTSVMYNGVKDPVTRQYEILTILYTLIIIVNIFSCIKQFNKFIFHNENLKIYVTLPIKMSTLFCSVMFFVFFRQVISTLIYALTVNIVFVKVTGVSLNILLNTIPVAILLPAFSIAVASIIAVPYAYLQNKLRNKYIVTLLIMTVFMGFGFYIYSGVLDIFSEMLFTGEIKFFFSEKVMNAIITLSNSLYPALFYSKFTLGYEMGKNIGIILGLTVGSLIIGSLMINGILTKVVKNNFSQNQKLLIKRKYTYNKKSLIGTLFVKELFTTLRTPSYAFQYFTTALIMPLLTVFCIRLGNEFTWNLIGLESNFEIAIFSVFIFSMLTNTYCATNISRDGDAFFMLKSYPITAKQYVFTKIMFCTIISFLSTLVTVIVIGSTGLVSWVQAMFILFASWLFSFSQICFATNLDLASPHFSKEENSEIKENNSTSSIVSVIGLVIATIVGGSSLLVRILLGLKGFQMNVMYSYLISGLASFVFCIIAFTGLMLSINKLYLRVREG